MPVVYITKYLGLREESADAKTYLTKALSLRVETQVVAGGATTGGMRIISAGGTGAMRIVAPGGLG